MTDSYRQELGTLRPNGRYALAVMDACRSKGFPAMVVPQDHREGYQDSSYVTIPHSSGVATARISNHLRVEAAAKRHGPMHLDIHTEKETATEAAARAVSSLSGLLPPDGAFCRLRLPAAFCGRIQG